MILVTTLNLFNKYADWLEEQFKDGLMITCLEDQGQTIFKIVHDPTISEEVINKKIPEAWKKAQEKEKIKIVLEKGSNDSEETSPSFIVQVKNKLVKMFSFFN